jgi:hypothetical protein
LRIQHPSRTLPEILSLITELLKVTRESCYVSSYPADNDLN